MIPSIDDRLASIVRALSDVVMPSLGPEASLAHEQLQLAIGHLQILRSQIDAAPEFEAEEAQDAAALGRELAEIGEGGAQTQAALVQLRAALGQNLPPRPARMAIHQAIDQLIQAAGIDGATSFRTALGPSIVLHQSVRTTKDRKWFEPMGFDAGL